MTDQTKKKERDNLPDAVPQEPPPAAANYRRLIEATRDGILNLDVVNEIRYRRLFESSRDGILMLDAVTRKITDANPLMVELLGYSRSEFLGKELWEIGLLKDEEASKAAFRELQVKGYIRYSDLPLETKAGWRREVEFISNVYTEGNRQVIQCNIHDITGRKAAETALSKLTDDLELAAEQYQRVLDHSLDVICQLNQAGEFKEVSAASRRVWGYRPDELIGRIYLELVFPDDQPKTFQVDLEIRSGHPTSTFENRYLRKDGTVADMIWSANWSEADQTMFCVARDISPVKRAEAALRESEANYRNLIESSPAIVYLIKPRPPSEPLYISPNIIKLGYRPEEFFDQTDLWTSLILEEDRPQFYQKIQEAMNQNSETDLEYRIVARDGAVHWVHDRGRFVFDEQGNKIGWQGLILDITKTKKLEEQLAQSQKLESIGRLAGGIAHDFNNMLTAIIGFSQLTLSRMQPDDPLRHNLEQIEKAGERSAELTNQLLAFSRRQILQPKLINLNEVLEETGNLLRRLLGEDIQFISLIDPELWFVMADFGQLTQIILNLTVNARDAMPAGGKLTVATANVFLDESEARRQAGAEPGAYVMLSVSDTGQGMSAETLKHIFEPFFTTKKVGQGTGLGLATVYGIVKQSGGSINIDSAEGVGTTFKIYLPQAADDAPQNVAGKVTEEQELSTATGAILLAEDEDIVRGLAKAVLEEHGYTVIEARNGLEALKICEAGDCQFDLLMTDVVMPGMGGRELADTLKEKLPDLQILFTSGYTDDQVVRHGVIEKGTNFIQKPYSPVSLITKIRELLI